MAKAYIVSHLQRISKLEKTRIKEAKYGVHIFQSSGRTIEQFISKATADRFVLGSHWLKVSRIALKLQPPQYRLAISRAYYSMYQTARALVFFSEEGDDYQEHSVLPGHLPANFPSVQQWKIDLKDARLLRNEVDYDPYPLRDAQFHQQAIGLVKKAGVFHTLVRKYLRNAGCRL